MQAAGEMTKAHLSVVKLGITLDFRLECTKVRGNSMDEQLSNLNAVEMHIMRAVVYRLNSFRIPELLFFDSGTSVRHVAEYVVLFRSRRDDDDVSNTIY